MEYSKGSKVLKSLSAQAKRCYAKGLIDDINENKLDAAILFLQGAAIPDEICEEKYIKTTRNMMLE